MTHEIITVTNQTYINAQSVCELLYKIATMYIDVPITIVLDNARYQKCEMVINLAKQLNIELLYLPSYSPQLNLIERFWKFVKKECLYSKYYHDYKQFENAIVECIKNANTKHKSKLKSLLTWNFQSFKNENDNNLLILPISYIPRVSCAEMECGAFMHRFYALHEGNNALHNYTKTTNSSIYAFDDDLALVSIDNPFITIS